jgi:hypothetical protein
MDAAAALEIRRRSKAGASGDGVFFDDDGVRKPERPGAIGVSERINGNAEAVENQDGQIG